MKKKGESRVFIFRVIDDGIEEKRGNGRIRLLFCIGIFSSPLCFLVERYI